MNTKIKFEESTHVTYEKRGTFTWIKIGGREVGYINDVYGTAYYVRVLNEKLVPITGMKKAKQYAKDRLVANGFTVNKIVTY